MLIYYFINKNGFSNCYIIANERTKETIIIDPSDITEDIINTLESNSFHLSSVLVTHNHKTHIQGIKILTKIYSPKIFGADWEIEGKRTIFLAGEGKIKTAGLTVHYMLVSGHSSDSMIYKIGNALFIGDVLSAGKIGSTNSSYSKYELCTNITQKILSQQDNTIMFPGHGPPTTVESEKQFNYIAEAHSDKKDLYLKRNNGGGYSN